MSDEMAGTEADLREDATGAERDDGESADSGSSEKSDRERQDAGDTESSASNSPEVEEEKAAEAELEAELDHLQDEFDSLKDRHLRLAADFENYRRRAENEMTESWVRAQADLVRRLLDALDDLQRFTGLDPTDTSIESVLEGVELVERKLVQSMKDAGVEVVEPEGERFDPEIMEAMMRVPAESDEDEDRVDQVFQKGYTFKGHLVRPARVSVMKRD